MESRERTEDRESMAGKECFCETADERLWQDYGYPFFFVVTRDKKKKKRNN